MPKFSYVAMDAHGKEQKGTLEVTSQNEAIGRVKEMGLFPTKIVEIDKAKEKPDKKAAAAGKPAKAAKKTPAKKKAAAKKTKPQARRAPPKKKPAKKSPAKRKR